MKTLPAILFLISGFLVPAAVTGQSDVRKRADALRASADELLKYWRIPWVTDAFEGFRLAREENRPVFLYTVVGNPLEDC